MAHWPRDLDLVVRIDQAQMPPAREVLRIGAKVGRASLENARPDGADLTPRERLAATAIVEEGLLFPCELARRFGNHRPDVVWLGVANGAVRAWCVEGDIDRASVIEGLVASGWQRGRSNVCRADDGALVTCADGFVSYIAVGAGGAGLEPSSIETATGYGWPVTAVCLRADPQLGIEPLRPLAGAARVVGVRLESAAIHVSARARPRVDPATLAPAGEQALEWMAGQLVGLAAGVDHAATDEGWGGTVELRARDLAEWAIDAARRMGR